ncbi:RNA-binding protein 48 [Linum perenne]
MVSFPKLWIKIKSLIIWASGDGGASTDGGGGARAVNSRFKDLHFRSFRLLRQPPSVTKNVAGIKRKFKIVSSGEARGIPHHLMPRYKDEPTAVRVYTVCDESRYLIVRNVPALGCGDELMNLFATYGDVEEVKPMDEEDCEEFTDVYWIKFRLANNARLGLGLSEI